MLVKMKQQIGGFRNGEPWPKKGCTIDLPAGEAADMVANRYAEYATAPVGEADLAPVPVEDDNGEIIEEVTVTVNGEPVEGTMDSMEGEPGEGVQLDAGDPPAAPIVSGGSRRRRV